MISVDAAYSVLGSITTATAALVGLVIIGMIFYLERSNAFHQSIIWMKNFSPIIPFYRWLRPLEIVALSWTLFTTIVLGLRLISDSVAKISTLPNSQVIITVDQQDIIDRAITASVDNFTTFLLYIGNGVLILLIMSYVLPWIVNELNSLDGREKLRRLESFTLALINAEGPGHVEGLMNAKGIPPEEFKKFNYLDTILFEVTERPYSKFVLSLVNRVKDYLIYILPNFKRFSTDDKILDLITIIINKRLKELELKRETEFLTPLKDKIDW